MVLLRSISRSIMPPVISIPSESGATSSNNMFCTSWVPVPETMAACTAAPYATASSGLMLLQSSLPLKKAEMSCCTLGILVEPPTRTISLIMDLDRPLSDRHWVTGSIEFLKKSMQSSSNLAREMRKLKSLPSCSESTSMVTCVCEESCRFARSHCVRRRRIARWFRVGSDLNFLRNSLMQWLSSRLSKSSPPKCGSPAVAFTSKTVSVMQRIETSKVPPPMSKTKMFVSSSLPLGVLSLSCPCRSRP
mmetsp:Transcript_131064/g.365269  ORF Transcript_131064/g.365269 Transcript_131064/m.365269 type:complete len:248 (-) Transcript_131064:268-1011(-)